MSNNKLRGEDDLGMIALLSHEIVCLLDERSNGRTYLRHLIDCKATIVILALYHFEQLPLIEDLKGYLGTIGGILVSIELPSISDPLNIRSEIALKMLMNAHSTAVMTKMGRVVGNTMSNVRAGNLKLIGRATFLVMTHVNDVLSRVKNDFSLKEITYAEANATLFETIDYLNT